jgi:hypothetical protein|nr:hypothetical protein [uncultured Brevundimonas sp.]
MKRLIALGLALTLAGCSHAAGTGVPPSPLARTDLIYGTQTTFGPCLGGESAVVAAVMSAVVSKGVNRIGTALKSAAEANTSTTLARRNLEISNQGPLGPCVYVARGWFHRQPPKFAGEAGGPSAYIARAGSQTDTVYPYDRAGELGVLWRAGLYLAATPDFFFQGSVTRTTGNTAYSVRPTLAWLAEPLVANTLRSDARSVLVSFAVVPIDKPATLEKGGSTVVVGQLVPGELRRFPRETCVARMRQSAEGPTQSGCSGEATSEDYTIVRGAYESEWFTVGLSAERQPMTLLALVTETRDASAFLGFVADVFAASEAPISTAIQNEIIPSAAAAADETEQAASEALQTAMDTAYGTAVTALDDCIANPSLAPKRAAARVALRGFTAAARRAEHPTPDLLAVEIDLAGTDATSCTAARTSILTYAPGR